MILYITVEEVSKLHQLAIRKDGGACGVRDAGLLESAVVNPQRSFGGQELYPELFDKAAILGYSIVRNHPFFDGNKRAGFAAMAGLEPD